MNNSSNNKQFNIAAFFSGVGGIELGFEQTNKFKTVYANEFDKYAAITYQLNYPHTFLDNRDIHLVNPDDISNEQIDLIVGGFPCQAFSIAGYQKGFKDERGDLFFELLRMIESKKPKAIFIENVKNMVTHDKGNTFKVIKEALTKNNYFIKWKVMNSKDYGNVPQNRERIYIVGFNNKQTYDLFNFPDKIPLTLGLKDVIDFSDDKDTAFHYSKDKQKFYDKLEESIVSQKTVYQWRRQYVRANKNGVVPTLTANMGTGGHNVPLILTDNKNIRKLTPKETFNIQGYPPNFKIPTNISNGQLYKQAGNSVVVPLIKRIAQNINDAMSKSDNIPIINTQGNISIIYTKINNKFEGKSYVKDYAKDYDSAKTIISSYNDNIKILSDKEYLKFVKKGVELEFYSIV